MSRIPTLGLVFMLMPALGSSLPADAADRAPSPRTPSVRAERHVPTSARHRFRHRPRVGISIYGGSYWGCPSPWGCGYGSPYAYPSYPPPDYAIIDTDVSPEKARVVLDGEEIGTADDFDGFPNYLEVDSGRHVLEFRAPGHRPLRITLNARRGRYYDIDRKLRRLGDSDAEDRDESVLGAPLRPEDLENRNDRDRREEARGDDEDRDREGAENDTSAMLVLKVRPEDAAVYVDGKLLGAGESIAAPEGVAIEPGRHVVDIVKPGYEPYRTTIVMREGERKSLAIRLTPEKD